MTSSVMMEILKPKLDEEFKNKIFSFVQAGELRLEFAASQFDQPAKAFAAEMKEKGYTIPPSENSCRLTIAKVFPFNPCSFV